MAAGLFFTGAFSPAPPRGTTDAGGGMDPLSGVGRVELALGAGTGTCNEDEDEVEGSTGRSGFEEDEDARRLGWGWAGG